MVVALHLGEAILQGDPPGADAALSLVGRVTETAALADRRGYGIPLEDFARVLYGGPAPIDQIEAAVREAPGLELVDGVVVQAERTSLAGLSRQRQASHAVHAASAQAIARDFAARLVSTCPLVRSIALSGSVSSGGFEPADDIDFNIIARDGSKYTVYLWALAVSALSSLRNRRKPTDEMGALPFLPKVVCVNVVWEESQVRPFVRQDKWLAYELMMMRALSGREYFLDCLAQNPWLQEYFPQLFDEQYHPAESVGPGVLRGGAGFFRFLARHPRALAATEAISRAAVIGLHRVVAILRNRRPAAKKRQEFVDTVKRPYTVYDIPGRERPIPAAALRPR